MSKIVFLCFVVFFYSCSRNRDISPAEQMLYDKVKVYQYHKKDVSDFSFLSKYRNLEHLDLTGTNVEDLSFLKNLPKLTSLVLIDTKVENIKPIYDLYRLRYLYLTKTNVKDFSALKGQGLHVLYIDEDKYEFLPISVKGEAVKISRNFLNEKKPFNFYDSRILDYEGVVISLFKSFDNVEYLDLSEYPFNDISGVSQLKDLKVLKLKTISKNIDALSQLSKLEELHLFGDPNNLSHSLEVSLSRLPKSLKKVYLYSMKISDYPFLERDNFEQLYVIGDSSYNIKMLKKKYPNKVDIKNKLFTPLAKGRLLIHRKNFLDNKKCDYRDLSYHEPSGPEIYDNEDYNFNEISKSSQKFHFNADFFLSTDSNDSSIIRVSKYVSKDDDLGLDKHLSLYGYKFSMFNTNTNKVINYDNISSHRDIEALRNNSLDFNTYLSLADYKFFMYNIGIDINHLWENNMTFLDKAIEDDNITAIIYLQKYGAKEGCIIKKEGCTPFKLDK